MNADFADFTQVYTPDMRTLCLCFLILVWIAQWLDWRAGLEYPSVRIRVSHT